MQSRGAVSSRCSKASKHTGHIACFQSICDNRSGGRCLLARLSGRLPYADQSGSVVEFATSDANPRQVNAHLAFALP